MRRDLERRLARAEITATAISWADYRAAQHRSSLRTQGKICDCILEYRAANGMTPELGELARQRDEVAIELANIPARRSFALPTRQSSVTAGKQRTLPTLSKKSTKCSIR